MNSLSWLLYMSEAIPSVAPLFVATGIAVVGASIGLFIYGGTEREGAYFAQSGYGAPARAAARETPKWQDGYAMQKRAFRLLPLCLPLFLLAAAIPSKQTILMIAASEMGEAVVKSPETQEIFTDLKAILKQQLEALKK